MSLAPVVQFHGMEPSQAIEAMVHDHVRKLERFCDNIVSCRVGIDMLSRHQRHGRPTGVRIDLTIPGFELVVNRVEHEDIRVAMREAFDDMRRQIEDVVRRRREPLKPGGKDGSA
jgi:ribosomal subunit interface protein